MKNFLIGLIVVITMPIWIPLFIIFLMGQNIYGLGKEVAEWLQ